jgi:eukaryotic-like serine/threonine-protein kinase
MIGVMVALREIHKIGLAHFDIKPGNILLSETYEPVIIDFGLAAYHSCAL